MWPVHDADLIRSFSTRLALRLELGGEVRCEPWREGASSAVWKLDIGEVAAVFKVGKLQDWRRLGMESTVLARIDGRGAPRQMAHGLAGEDLPWDWSVQERIEGCHPFQLSLSSAGELGRTLARLRRIEFGSELGWQSWREFVSSRVRSPVSLCASVPTELLQVFSDLLSEVEGKSRHGEALDSSRVGIVHGDVIPLNIVEKDNGAVRVLDWENPRLGSAAWDLAGIRKAFKLDPGAWDSLVGEIDEPTSPESIEFADVLQQLQVAAWRVETWWGRGIHAAGFQFLQELDGELETARRLLARI